MSFQTNPVFERVDVLDKSYYTYPIQKSITKTRSLKMKFIRNKIKSIGKRILGIFIELWFITLKPNIDFIINEIILPIPSVLVKVYKAVLLLIIITIHDISEKISKMKFVKKVRCDFKIMNIVILNRFKYLNRRKRKRVRERKYIEPEVVSAVSAIVVIAITMIVMSTFDMNNHQQIKDANNSIESTVYQTKKYNVDNLSSASTSLPPIVTNTTTVVVTEEETLIPETIMETEPVQTEPVIEETSIVYTESETINNDITIDDKSSMTLLGNLRLTGYVATGNKTANGEIPYVGGVAMNRSYGLPYGTEIYIEGVGNFIINDTGCKTGVVDIFCNTVEECYALTSYANVYVVN